MKKIINIWVLAIALSIFYSGCTSTFDDLNTNPNATTSVQPSMLATNVIVNMVTSALNSNYEFLAKRAIWGEQISDWQYNCLYNADFSSMELLTSAQKMVELADDTYKDAYTGLYYFMKGWYFWRATMDVGEIPYTQALNVDKYPYPEYDEQVTVFKGILSDLAKADEYFGKATTSFGGDPFYSGNPKLWRKATNVLRLKVLMSLQKRADDTADLNIKSTFSKIVSEGNLFTSNDDNLQVVYSNDYQTNQNPLRSEETNSINVYSATSMIVGPFQEYKDYRLFSYFEPALARTDSKYASSGQTLLTSKDFGAYIGINPATVFADARDSISKNLFSKLNDLYRLTTVGVPSIRLGYADMNFILAEAAERGWISGSAKDYYDKGVRASFEFVRSTVSSTYNHGMNITDDYINSYLKAEKTAYKVSGTTTDRLRQIWMQAYLAGFFHMSKDSYYEYRRTGYPVFPINPNTNLNTQNDKMPVRWLYPTSENNYNKDQLNVSLNRQWSGSDDVNNVMWLLK